MNDLDKKMFDKGFSAAFGGFIAILFIICVAIVVATSWEWLIIPSRIRHTAHDYNIICQPRTDIDGWDAQKYIVDIKSCTIKNR